jgi:hypothetical protein
MRDATGRNATFMPEMPSVMQVLKESKRNVGEGDMQDCCWSNPSLTISSVNSISLPSADVG